MPPTKAKAERALAEAVRDRARYDNGAEIRPDMRVAALAEAWFRDVSSGDRSPSTWSSTATGSTARSSRPSANCGSES